MAAGRPGKGGSGKGGNWHSGGFLRTLLRTRLPIAHALPPAATPRSPLMFDHPQKAVLRTPFVTALHPTPEGSSPLPLGPAKAIAGFVHGGLWGALKMVLRRE